MLCDVQYHHNLIATLIAEANGNSTGVKRIREGIYEIGHFSFDLLIGLRSFEKKFPELYQGFNCYGVCDNLEQVLEQCPELETSDRRFVLSLTPVLKKNQSAEGGWRWHKWGPYIGTKTPRHEYLYDEEDIDMVFVYHIHEL